jgi:hypothetical protein
VKIVKVFAKTDKSDNPFYGTEIWLSISCCLLVTKIYRSYYTREREKERERERERE